MARLTWNPSVDGAVTLERNTMTLNDIESIIVGGAKELEEFKPRVNKKLYRAFEKMYKVASCSFLSVAIPNVVMASSTTSAVEDFGNTVINGIQVLSVFVVTAMCLFDCLKAIIENDPKRIPGAAVKFAIGLFIIYVVPELFFLMREHFEKVGVVNGGPGIFNSKEKSVPASGGA